MKDQLREQIYDHLTGEFRSIDSQLDDEGKVELDGKLWRLAVQLDEAISLIAIDRAVIQSGRELFTNREKRIH